MKFSEFEEYDLNLLGEIGNISVGGAATSLSDFVNKLVTISIPDTKLQAFKEIKKQFEPAVVFAKVDYSEGLSGSNILLMKKEEAFNFSKIIVKEKLNIDLTEWDDFAINALAEMFNIMVGNMSSSMSEMFHKNIKIKTPEIFEEDAQDIAFYNDDEKLITIWFELRIENAFKIKLLKIITIEQAKQMIKILEEEEGI